MTIIAAYKESEIPILIGDIMISRIGIDKAHISLPTRDDVDTALPTEWHRNISGMYPKLILINPYLAIGWTGGLIAAKTIIEDIEEKFSQSPYCPEDFIDFLKEQEPSRESMELTIIGWTIIEDQIIAFSWDSKTPKALEYGDKFIEGSGKEYFERSITERKEYKESKNIDQADKAILNPLSLIGGLLADEIITGENIPELFGGGYQIIIFHEGRFVFIDDYQIILLIFEEKDDGVFLKTPNYFLKHSYVDNHLVIKRLVCKDMNTEGVLNDANNKSFIVTRHPHEVKITDERFLNQGLESNFYTCICLLGIDETRYVQAVVSFPESTDFIRIEEASEERKNFKIKHDLIESVVPRLISLKKLELLDNNVNGINGR